MSGVHRKSNERLDTQGRQVVGDVGCVLLARTTFDSLGQPNVIEMKKGHSDA